MYIYIHLYVYIYNVYNAHRVKALFICTINAGSTSRCAYLNEVFIVGSAADLLDRTINVIVSVLNSQCAELGVFKKRDSPHRRSPLMIKSSKIEKL